MSVELALTLWRPWTAIVLVGPKFIENRPWKPPRELIGKRIAIHASKQFHEEGWLRARDLLMKQGFDAKGDEFWRVASVKMAIVGTAVVDGYISHDQVADSYVGSSREIVKHITDPWFSGPVGWVLSDRRALERPVPCKGAQKLWTMPPDVREAVEAQL